MNPQALHASLYVAHTGEGGRGGIWWEGRESNQQGRRENMNKAWDDIDNNK